MILVSFVTFVSTSNHHNVKNIGTWFMWPNRNRTRFSTPRKVLETKQ